MCSSCLLSKVYIPQGIKKAIKSSNSDQSVIFFSKMEGKENFGFSSNNSTFLVVPDLQRQNTYVYDADQSLSGMTVSNKKSNFLLKKSINLYFGPELNLKKLRKKSSFFNDFFF